MAKARIDTASIEGYDSMTAEEKLAALEAFEYEDLSSEVERYKNAVTKANSEAADWKKKHNALLSADEAKKQEEAEEVEKLREKVKNLEEREKLSGYKAKYVAMGYDEKLAEDTAKALLSGDTDKVFSNQQSFIASHDKAFKAQLMGQNITPPGGKVPDPVMNREAFLKLSPKDRLKYSEDHPEEYKQMYEGGTK